MTMVEKIKIHALENMTQLKIVEGQATCACRSDDNISILNSQSRINEVYQNSLSQSVTINKAVQRSDRV